MFLFDTRQKIPKVLKVVLPKGRHGADAHGNQTRKLLEMYWRRGQTKTYHLERLEIRFIDETVADKVEAGLKDLKSRSITKLPTDSLWNSDSKELSKNGSWKSDS